jgi:uncharacterized protein
MEIVEQLTLLAELANVEAKLKVAKDKLEGLPAEAKRAQAQAEQLSQKHNELDMNHTDVEMARRRLESELAGEKAKLKKWQSRADQIRGEREAAALGSEIGAQKRSISNLEESILEKMQELEDLQKARDEGLAAATAASASSKEEWKKVEADVVLAEGVVKGHERARDALLEKLPAPLVKRYQRIAERRQGVAIAILKGEMCSFCKVSMPPQLCILIYKGAVLETCSSCQRILVHEAMTRAPAEGGEAASA